MSNEIVPNFYSIIPADLRYDNRLKATEKIFFSEISALTNLYGYCYARNKYFSKLYNCDIRTITRWISNLEELGYIITELIRDEKQTILERRIYTRESLQGDIDRNVHRGIDKNVRYNNIYINNISHTQELENFKKEYAEKVYLLQSEYQSLVMEYGDIKTNKCIAELNLYKKSKGVEYASDYDTIQRWVIDRVNEKELKQSKVAETKKTIKKKTGYANYEQRDYPAGFFDQFYAD